MRWTWRERGESELVAVRRRVPAAAARRACTNGLAGRCPGESNSREQSGAASKGGDSRAGELSLCRVSKRMQARAWPGSDEARLSLSRWQPEGGRGDEREQADERFSSGPLSQFTRQVRPGPTSC